MKQGTSRTAPQEEPSRITLPARQAFVLQFGTDTDAGTGRFVGRIEHVVSGESGRFRSPDDFMAFVKRILNGLASEEEGELPRAHPPGS